MAWLYKRPDSDKFWLGYRVNGRQVLRSTKTTDEAEAKRQLASLQQLKLAHSAGNLTQEFYEALTGKIAAKKTLRAAIDAWLAESSSRTKGGTMDRYKRTTNDFSTFIKATEQGPMLADVDTETVRAYLTARVAGASASTANLDRKILRVFFHWATQNAGLKVNPMLPIKLFKDRAAKQARRAFTLKEFRELLAKAPNDFWRYMILAGFYTGLRLGDLVCLDWASVDFNDGVLRVIPLKTSGTSGKTVHVPIHSSLRAGLERLWQTQGEPSKGPLWPEQAARYHAKGSNRFSNEFYDIMAKCGLVQPRSHEAAKEGRKANSARRV
jgi:integrase